MKRISIKGAATRGHFQRVKKNNLAVGSLWLLGVMSFLSITAEFWCNSKPIYLNFMGKSYFPIFVDYHPTEFSRADIFKMDYRALKLSASDRVAWPIVQWDPYESNSSLESYPSPPSPINLFGTDDRGRDVLTRILYGFRYTLAYALGVWFFAYLVGVTFGAITGYFGGYTDLIGMRVIEVIESMPTLLLLLTLISVFSPSIYLLVAFSALFGWTTIATYTRAEFLALRKREFVESARALGATHFRIVTKHILPNALLPVITFSPFMIAGNLLTLLNMDYLGLGMPVPTPSWGELLSQAQRYLMAAEWLVWWPSFFLVITLLALLNIGLAFRDAFDPKN
jgi:microcin C transport system permease protein